MKDRVEFSVRGSDYNHLQAAAITKLNEFYARDIQKTKPPVVWTLFAQAEAESMDGKTTLWRGEVEAWIAPTDGTEVDRRSGDS